jgi:DNA-binding CsgD family transcriptional regulator
MSQPLDQWPLVGRTRELEAFQAALGSPGRQAFVIHGVSGTGKTRLAEECCRAAANQGLTVARAVASQLARKIPLGAVGHLLPSQVDPGEPGILFARTAEHLAGEGGRLVLFVDDMHLLDATSAVLIGQLIDRGPVFLIGTVNSDQPSSEAVLSLDQGEQVTRIDLAELSLAEVNALLRAVLGAPVDRGTAFRLHEVSGGILLFLRELVSSAVESGALTGQGGIWRLTGTPHFSRKLVELIEGRLSSVGDDDRRMLQLIAVCGPMETHGLDLPVLTRLERAGLIRMSMDGRRAQVSLVHPIYGEILRSGTPSAERRRMLSAAATRLERSGMRRRGDQLLLATRLLEATGSAEVQLLWKAVTAARYAYDFATVAELSRALARLDASAGPRMLLGEALHELGATSEADNVLAEAALTSKGDEEYLLVALLRIQLLLFSAFQPQEAERVAAAVCERLNQPEAVQAVSVNTAWAQTLLGESSRACELLSRIPPDADSRIRLAAALPRGWALVEAGRPAEAVELADRAYREHAAAEAAIAVAYPGLQQQAHIIGLAGMGCISQARELGESLYTRAVADRALVAQMWTAVCLGKTEYLAGRMADAMAWYATALAISGDHNFRACRWIASLGSALCCANVNNTEGLDAAWDVVRELAPAGQQRAEYLAIQGWRLAVTGSHGKARDMLAEAASLARQTGAAGIEAEILSDIVRLGDAGRVSGRLAELAGGRPGTLAALRAAHATAMADNDPHALERCGLDLADRGVLMLGAEALLAAAGIYQAGGHTARSIECAARGNQLAAECGGIRAVLPVAQGINVSLTRREREIARLAAQGLSSQEIAERLVISLRTVDSHLLNTYRKTGITSRKELSAILDILDAGD